MNIGVSSRLPFSCTNSLTPFQSSETGKCRFTYDTMRGSS